MPMKSMKEAQKRFLESVGADLRAMREASGKSLHEVASIFDWNRDAMSKIERGINNMTLYEYLRLIRSYEEIDPSHPALTLADRYMPRSRKSCP